MSTIPKTASDSEDDSDFVPQAEQESDSSDDEPDLKRARTSSPKPTAEEELASKNARKELWANFQASVDVPEQKPQDEPKRMVKIEKRYLFAGEHTVEVVEVPEGSADAKKWPLWRPPEEAAASSSSVQATPLLSAPTTSDTRPPAKRPGPRKPKTSLASIPTQKAKKLSTLDKSAMDWRAHVNAEPADTKDELEANRRGGGYLEKVEFLSRVDARKEDALEASKGTKRRR
ncbi:bucentaur or craniofacial development-domain-containing protein [Mycena albidolilacea]|uniref:SWR1-complex protein 5 n=1 Tax=Mycena albidolilacea TaxID=1033008 RepID=A0AAD6ZIA9_9AGAR|nr:bucentaur or craniofacial development-domain-containing protein [Mycena albidolilacea]